MGITLILCKESWRVLWTLFTQGGHEYRGSRQFLSFLISLAYPDQLRLKLPRPGCHRNQGKGIGQSDVSKKLPNILRCDFLMDSCVRVCMLSHSVMSDCVTRWTVACQAPVSMGFPRQEYWSGLSFLSLLMEFREVLWPALWLHRLENVKHNDTMTSGSSWNQDCREKYQ